MRTKYGQEISAELAGKAAGVKLFVCDVDGVLSDGLIYMTERGDEIKTFCAKDGSGIKAFMKQGGAFAVITGRTSEIVRKRMSSLGVEMVVQGVTDKTEPFEKMLADMGIGLDEAAYMGDDSIDIPLMKMAGLSFAPADAHPDAANAADIRTTLPGGRGCVREAIDFMLLARGASENGESST